MAENEIKVRIKHAVKTTDEWEKSNPVLLLGEVAYDSALKRFKTGDGESTWKQLPYDDDLLQRYYLPLNGGTMTGQIQKEGISSDWVYGRDNAVIRMKSVNGYSPFASVKTNNGSWEIGSYDHSAYTDDLIFSYVLDSDYNSGINTIGSQIRFKSNGHINGVLDGISTSSYYLATYSADGSDNISALKNVFNNIPKSVGTAIRLQHGSHSMALGWFLSGYEFDNAYGGWFISDYGSPSWVGIDNGTWSSAKFITDNNYYNYALPLSGGTLSGDLSFSSYDKKINFIHGSTGAPGGKIYLDSSGMLNVYGDYKVKVNGSLVTIGSNGSVTEILGNKYSSIGSSSSPFNVIYSSTFIGNLSGTTTYANFLNVQHGNEINFTGATDTNQWFNHRNGNNESTSGNTAITNYYFGNRNASTSGVTLVADYFSGTAANADTVDGLHGSSFLRKYNTNDEMVNTDALYSGSYIFTHGDGGNGGWTTTGTKPSGSHNGVAILHTHTHAGNYYTQLALDTNQNYLWIRSANNTTTFGSWAKILTDANYTSTTDSRYVLKSGDTMTGALTTTNLFVVNDSSNNDYNALAYFRHYANHDWGMIIDKNNDYNYGIDIRVAGTYALRINNNYYISGSGYFNGNVASADKWSTARTLSLTGSVTGSVSIDGSGNVSLATTTNHTHLYAGSSSAGGAANSSNWLNTNASLTYGASGLQYFNQSTATSSGANVNANPSNDWYHIIRMNHANANGYYADLATCFHSNAMYYRRIAGGTDGGWVRLLDSSNYSNYCTPKDHVNLLPWAVFKLIQSQTDGEYVYIYLGTNNTLTPTYGNSGIAPGNFSLNGGNRSYIECPRTGYVKVTANLAVKASAETQMCVLEFVRGGATILDETVLLGRIGTYLTPVNGTAVIQVTQGDLIQLRVTTYDKKYSLNSKTLHLDYSYPFYPNITLEYIS